jgi:hypothetical protein
MSWSARIPTLKVSAKKGNKVGQDSTRDIPVASYPQPSCPSVDLVTHNCTSSEIFLGTRFIPPTPFLPRSHRNV